MIRAATKAGLVWAFCAFFALACGSTSHPPPAGTVPSTDDAGAGNDASSSSGGGDASSSSGGDSGTPALPGTWCADHPHAFCDDFDDPARTKANWGTFPPPGGALDTTSSTSAPNSFTSKTSALAAGAFETVQIQGSSKAPEGKAQVEADFAFDVRVNVGAGARIEVARVQGVNPINFREYGFSLLVSQTGASIELRAGSAAPETKPLVTAPAAGAFTRVSIHLVMTVVVNGPPTAITVQIGGGAPESFSLEAGMGVRPFFFLGAKVSGPADPAELRYDNVAYDAR